MHCASATRQSLRSLIASVSARPSNVEPLSFLYPSIVRDHYVQRSFSTVKRRLSPELSAPSKDDYLPGNHARDTPQRGIELSKPPGIKQQDEVTKHEEHSHEKLLYIPELPKGSTSSGSHAPSPKLPGRQKPNSKGRLSETEASIRPSFPELDKLVDTLHLNARNFDIATKESKQLVANNLAKQRVRSQLREKADWSFDWTVAFQDLQEALYRQLAETTKQHTGSKSPSESKAGDKATATVSQDSFQVVKKVYIGVPISDIPIPKIWTKASFAQYVHDLCRSRMTLQQTRAFRERSGTHPSKMILRYLEQVLFTSANAEFMSEAAFETALRFYYRYEHLKSVQRLFFFIREINFPFSNRLVDFALRNAALKKDLHNFTALLKGGISIGFVPTESTWVSLLMCVESQTAQHVVYESMAKNNLIKEVKTRQDVACESVKWSLLPKDTQNLDALELVDRVERLHGKEALSQRLVNTILKHLCIHSMTGKPIAAFLQQMANRGCIPDLDAMNLLLARCRRAGDVEAALNVLEKFITTYSVIPDSTSYEALFQTAWLRRLPNTGRVIWTAACANGRLSRPIEAIILKSLAISDEGQSKYIGTQWQYEAGRLIPGFGYTGPDPDYRVLVNVQKSSKDDPSLEPVRGAILHFCQTQVKFPKLRDGSLARRLVNYDLSLSLKYSMSMDQFLTQLNRAYAMDVKWKEDKLYNLPLLKRIDLMIMPELRKRSSKARYYERRVPSSERGKLDRA